MLHLPQVRSQKHRYRAADAAAVLGAAGRVRAPQRLWAHQPQQQTLMAPPEEASPPWQER
jgi:hypothetical protein